MVVIVIDALVSIVMVAFMLNRLYVIFAEQQINVKGIIYSRVEQPIYYWFWVVAVTFGLCAGVGLLSLSITWLIGRASFV